MRLVHANGDGDVGPQPGVEADLPAEGARSCRLTSHHHDGSRELVVDGQEIGGRVLLDRASRLFDPRDRSQSRSVGACAEARD